MKRLQLILLTAVMLPTLAGAATWAIDPDHSLAQFKVRHMMISDVRGNFPGIQGTVVIDDQNLGKSTVDVVIDAASLDTRQAKRDAHLKSPDFFDVEKFPTITFKSKSVAKGSGDTLRVVGDLTIHGITKEVELTVTGPSPSIKDPWGNLRRGAQATTTVNRKDFGLVWNKALESGGVVVGDEVQITIEVELLQKAG